LIIIVILILISLIYNLNHYFAFVLPTIPHPILGPALPVFKESSVPPSPKSSLYLCTTQLLPMIEYGPTNDIFSSMIVNVATPFSSALMLPKSPTWLWQSCGPPCV
jgi:hypothetical protein